MPIHSDFTLSNLQKNKGDVHPKTQSKDAPWKFAGGVIFQLHLPLYCDIFSCSYGRKESDSLSYQLLFQVCRTS